MMSPWFSVFFLIYQIRLSKLGSLNDNIALHFDLKEAHWLFRSRNGSVSGNATVPGDIYADLFNNKIIGEPLRENNDQMLRWVALTDWIYEALFTMNETWREFSAVLLNVRGLDTIATVTLNGALVMRTKNQFLSYLIPLEVWKVGLNNLTIEFKSPVKYSKKQSRIYEVRYGHDIPPKCPPPEFQGECHVNFIRKVQASYSWDWGPSFPTVGVWLPLSLEGVNKAFIDRISAKVDKINEEFVILLELQVFSAVASSSVGASASIPELKQFVAFTGTLKAMKLSQLSTNFSVPAHSVELWWPNGSGEQRLYTLTANVKVEDSVIYANPIRIGFRTVKLVQNFVDPSDKSKGRNFYFTVNDMPIFLKGSNMIPISAFPARNHSKRMEFLLESAREANMNAMRVWGGGRYEDDEFYEFADRKGILIWHDLMFACALYPVDIEFLKSVQEEVTQQVRRLRHHPSILVWTGNNENEFGLMGNWWSERNYPMKLMKRDYVKLYRDTIESVMKELDNSRPYLFSSPSNGIEIEKEAIGSDPNSQLYGDIHFYNEFVDLWADASYRIPRCATEFGVQSLPRKETFLHWINQSEWSYKSKQMVVRQHHPGGLLTLITMTFSHFKIPRQCSSSSVESVNNCAYIQTGSFLDRFVYLTQMHQAIALQTQAEHYRRWRGRLDKAGQGNTMCALYWQLNDIWAAPTWSSIDFDLSWKPSHYFAKRFFNKIIVSMSLSNQRDLEVYIVSDATEELKEHKVVLDMLSWTSGFQPVYSLKKIVDVPPLISMPVNVDLKSLIQSSKNKNMRGPEEYVIRTRLYAPEGSQIGYDSVLLPDQLYKADETAFGVVEIKTFEEVSATNYTIRLKAERIAPLVWLSLSPKAVGWFSDNAFTMTEPEKSVTLTVITSLKLPLNKDDISVCSLANCGFSS